jgi:hypothetical protein
VVFVLVQQLMIVDMSHNWNEAWVERSNRAELEEAGSGRKWLAAILASCFVMYALAVAGLVYLFVDFTGCPTNNAFISVTLVGCVAITAVQLTGEEGSLLSSATVCLYATYLLYSAATKNPDPTCNPALGLPTVANIVLGLLVCALSLGYTGWSYTAEDKLSSKASEEDEGTRPAAAAPYQPPAPDGNGGERKKVAGVVVGPADGKDEELGDGKGGGNNPDEEAGAPPAGDGDRPGTFSNSWRLNGVLATVCCWTAVVLTEWGAVSTSNRGAGNANTTESGLVANPGAGLVAMWMVIASQWIVMLLYLWTLAAPRLFPGRDFS